MSEIDKVGQKMRLYEAEVSSMVTLVLTCSDNQEELSLPVQRDNGIKRFIKTRVEYATNVS